MNYLKKRMIFVKILNKRTRLRSAGLALGRLGAGVALLRVALLASAHLPFGGLGTAGLALFSNKI